MKGSWTNGVGIGEVIFNIGLSPVLYVSLWRDYREDLHRQNYEVTC